MSKIVRLLVIVIFLICTNATVAQRITLFGYVSDVNSGERLSGASVTVPLLGTGTTTNAYGFYSITVNLPGDSLEMMVSFTGFVTQVATLETKDQEVHFKLQANNTLEEVVIAARATPRIQNTTQMSSIGISAATIKALPAFLGETDVLKAIQLLPGIQAGTEGSSGLYVRGGSPDQNLMLLDGVPVYNASHLFGFFSVFNADAINGVDVIKGGFPARYGGRLSSVIDIRMKEGNNQEYKGEGSIGLIASKLTLEGPIQKGKSSFMVSGRRTYADLFLRPIIKSESDGATDAGYYFYDLNAKLNFKLSDKDQVYLSGYFGRDQFSVKEEYSNDLVQDRTKIGIFWGNATAVARWNHRFNKKLFSNFTANYTQYRFQLEHLSFYKNNNNAEADTYNEQYFSGIKDWTIKTDFDWMPHPNHLVKMGISNTWHKYSPGAIQSTGSSSLDIKLQQSEINNMETDVYIEDDIKITDRLKTNLGVHHTMFTVKEKTFHSLQPRISARYLLNQNMSLKASYVKMNQFIHLLTNSSIGLPTDLWLPATVKVPPQQSTQYALGWAYDVKRKYELSVEAYYKSLNNVMEYAEGSGFLSGITNWEDRIEIGKGNAYGAEFFLQKKTGKTTGLIGYTLSWSNRQFDNLNNGKTFPYKYDRRHDFKIAVIHHLTPKIQLSGDWIYTSGSATTLPLATYQIGGNTITAYGERNGYRLPAYHRMDLSIRFIKQKKRYERSWVVSVYNVYNRLNTFYITLEDELDFYGGSSRSSFKKVTLFPIIPSISYQFKF